MEYLHHGSVPATKEELELFRIPPTETAIDKYYEVQYRPTSTLESTRNYDFVIPASDDFTDLSETMIYVRLQVLKGNSTALAATDTNVFPVLNFGNALFEQVDFYLGGTSITPANNLHHYQAFLEDLLFRHPNPIDIGSLWHRDKTKRQSFIKESRELDLYFRLHNSLCEQNNLLLSGVPITIKFCRSKDSFCLESSEEYKIKIHEIFIVIKRVRLFSDVNAGIQIALDKAPAKYFITRNETKSLSIGSGFNSVVFDNVYSGSLPDRFFICFVSNNSFSGKKDANPFELRHFNLNYIVAYVDGTMVPSIPYTPDFQAKRYMREYVSLYKYINQHEGIPQLDISHERYLEEVLFAFDFSPDCSTGAESGYLSLVRRGNIRVEVKFKEALENPIHMIVFAQFDNLIQIDKFRNITLDY